MDTIHGLLSHGVYLVIFHKPTPLLDTNVLDNCLMADVDDINIQVLNRSNVSSDSTFINITGLSDNTCYIFGVRAGTVNGYGEWTVIANETLEQSATCVASINSGIQNYNDIVVNNCPP